MCKTTDTCLMYCALLALEEKKTSNQCSTNFFFVFSVSNCFAFKLAGNLLDHVLVPNCSQKYSRWINQINTNTFFNGQKNTLVKQKILKAHHRFWSAFIQALDTCHTVNKGLLKSVRVVTQELDQVSFTKAPIGQIPLCFYLLQNTTNYFSFFVREHNTVCSEYTIPPNHKDHLLLYLRNVKLKTQQEI